MISANCTQSEIISRGGMSSQDDARRAARRQREPQERQRVPIAPTETIRNRLGLNKENFSEALGFHPSTYAGYLTKGQITKTGSLAAEALMRRQASTGEMADEVFILRIIKGTPTAMRVNQLEKMILKGEEFYLVPAKDTRI